MQAALLVAPNLEPNVDLFEVLDVMKATNRSVVVSTLPDNHSVLVRAQTVVDEIQKERRTLSDVIEDTGVLPSGALVEVRSSAFPLETAVQVLPWVTPNPEFERGIFARAPGLFLEAMENWLETKNLNFAILPSARLASSRVALRPPVLLSALANVNDVVHLRETRIGVGDIGFLADDIILRLQIGKVATPIHLSVMGVRGGIDVAAFLRRPATCQCSNVRFHVYPHVPPHETNVTCPQGCGGVLNCD